MAVMWLEVGIDAVPRSPGVRTAPAGRLLAATTTEVRWAEDWKSAPATAARHEDQRHPETDLPGTALVAAGGQAQAAVGSRRSEGDESGPWWRRSGCGHRSSSSSVVDGFDLGDLQRGRRLP